MPTILRIGAYRFFFYSDEGTEPPHVHVRSGGKTAKFWLEPIRLQKGGRFNKRELNQIQRIIEQHQAELLEEWYGYFSEN